MFDFNKVESPQKLNRDFILSKVTDSMIFGYYFGKFDLKSIYPSALRPDKHPSTGFYVNTKGKLIYNDLAGRMPKLDCFDFVQTKYHCDFKTAMNKIATDFGLISGTKTPEAEKIIRDLADFDKSYKKETRIHFIPLKWNSETLRFWKDYYITKDELIREGVYPIKKLYINDVFIPNRTHTPRYALTVPYKGEILTKVYSPESDGIYKWISNIPLDIPFGIPTFNRKASFSFTTKAVKCMIVVKKFLPAVLASQNENKSSFSLFTLKSLNLWFGDHNYLGWDNDETGLENMNEICTEGIKILDDEMEIIFKNMFRPLFIPVEYRENENIKDYSDFAKAKGLKALERFFKERGLI